MVLVLKWPFFQLSFTGNIGHENVFYDILERKTAFWSNKNKKFKKSNNWHFSKGLTHGFGPKMAIFPTFFYRQYRPWKCLLRYSSTKNRLLRLKKTRSSKSRKIDIIPKGLTHVFGPKMAIFQHFFLGNIGHENVFYDILQWKSAFLG